MGEPDRYDKAVDVLLNSPLLTMAQMTAFWQYVDGILTEDELREALQ